eukprot:CCRYP_000041-RA/>CCRYP_000041-RA protein AED:0.08 eAED:0.08 QI:234/1/1/1/1/0.87/8/1429/370
MVFSDDQPIDEPHEVDISIPQGFDIQFSHVHLYVDRVDDLHEYKQFEDSINKFHHDYDATASSSNQHGTSMRQDHPMNVVKGQEIWTSIQNSIANSPHVSSECYSSHGRDVVKQLIAGFGYRVTGCYPAADATSSSKTVLVTSNDPMGIQIVVSSRDNEVGDDVHDEKYLHFDAANMDTFFRAHANRQGIAVLAFEVGPGCLQEIHQRYSQLHPQLLVDQYKDGVQTYENEVSVLEVFAYYTGDKGVSSPDEGTILRFLEGNDLDAEERCKLPGMVSVPAKFHHSSHPAYFDHWVSNVFSRTGFLETLEDTLYFTPKVDFNAGVVAAGEAQIESTVTGNVSSMSTSEKDSALKDQSQIYLPINNALTKVG